MVICRIGKNTKIEASPDRVAAVDHNTVDIGMQEFIIEKDGPLSVEDFSMTMRHEGTVGTLSTKAISSKCIEGIWELSSKISEVCDA